MSSHVAADRLEKSGRAARQAAEALSLVYQWPGRTSKELAGLEYPDDEIGRLRLYDRLKRRMSELREQGLIEAFHQPSGTRWYPCRKPPVEVILDERLT